jgi:hypothetical protein
MQVLVLINGTSVHFFNSSRGMRQEDPLSSLLFVVVMEVLSRMVSATMNKGLLPSFSVRSRNNGRLILSHLLFTDDTLFFCEENLDRLCYLHCRFLCLEELVHVSAMEDVKGLVCILGWRVSFLIRDGIIEKMKCCLIG